MEFAIHLSLFFFAVAVLLQDAAQLIPAKVRVKRDLRDGGKGRKSGDLF